VVGTTRGAPPEGLAAAPLTGAAARTTGRLPRWPVILVALGLAAQLAPVLLLRHVLTQDGPAHVYGAWVLLHHGDDDAVGAALRSAFTVDLTPVPNMFTTLIMVGLLAVLGPDAAEKAVVAGFVLLLVAGLAYALRGVDRRAGWLCVVALPLAGGQLVAFGFYNFCWGVALALFAVGVALRRRTGWTLAPALVAALLLVLTWSAHLLPWLVAVLVMGGLAAGRWLAAVRAGAPPRRAAVGHLLVPLAAVIPGVGLSIGYLVHGGGEHGAAGGWDAGRLGDLLTLYRPLVVGSWWELLPSVAVAAVLAALAVVAVRGRRSRPERGDLPAAISRADRRVLGVATLLSVAVYLVTPSRLGSEYGFLSDRLAWFPPLLLVLFCATRPPSRRAWQRVAAGVLVLAAIAGALVRLPTQLADQRTAAELLSVASVLPPGATFAVLRYTGHRAVLAPLDGEPNPLRHLSSRLAVEVGGVDVGNYEAVFPYFQVRFPPGSVREVIDPGLHGLDAVPPWVHLSAAGARLPYVVVVGHPRAGDSVRSAERTAGVLADLRAHYAQIATSRPSGDVSVWRLRTATGG